MATKDWNKLSSGGWNKVGGLWYNSKTGIGIEVNMNKFKLYNDLYIPYKTKTFKTKSQALKFARAYMRKH